MRVCGIIVVGVKATECDMNLSRKQNHLAPPTYRGGYWLELPGTGNRPSGWTSCLVTVAAGKECAGSRELAASAPESPEPIPNPPCRWFPPHRRAVPKNIVKATARIRLKWWRSVRRKMLGPGYSPTTRGCATPGASPYVRWVHVQPTSCQSLRRAGDNRIDFQVGVGHRAWVARCGHHDMGWSLRSTGGPMAVSVDDSRSSLSLCQVVT